MSLILNTRRVNGNIIVEASGRLEALYDGQIRFVGLSEWRWIAGFEPGGDRLLDEVERTLDVYFGGGPLSLTVRAGLGPARS